LIPVNSYKTTMQAGPRGMGECGEGAKNMENYVWTLLPMMRNRIFSKEN